MSFACLADNASLCICCQCQQTLTIISTRKIFQIVKYLKMNRIENARENAVHRTRTGSFISSLRSLKYYSIKAGNFYVGCSNYRSPVFDLNCRNLKFENQCYISTLKLSIQSKITMHISNSELLSKITKDLQYLTILF